MDTLPEECVRPSFRVRRDPISALVVKGVEVTSYEKPLAALLCPADKSDRNVPGRDLVARNSAHFVVHYGVRHANSLGSAPALSFADPLLVFKFLLGEGTGGGVWRPEAFGRESPPLPASGDLRPRLVDEP